MLLKTRLMKTASDLSLAGYQKSAGRAEKLTRRPGRAGIDDVFAGIIGRDGEPQAGLTMAREAGQYIIEK
jgi:hypothetical protein